MALRGLDIASYQDGIDLGACDYDFAIVKATQGTSYTWRKAREWADAVLSRGKLLGLYHYANGADAASEADHFLTVAGGYVGRAVLCLDWESQDNQLFGSGQDSAWVDAFRSRVHDRTGVWPIVYVQASAIGAVGVDARHLWVAQYASMEQTGYQDSPWREGAYGCVMRQYTSTGRVDGYGADIDLDKFYGGVTDWAALAKGGDAMPDSIDAVCDDGRWWVEHGNLGYDQGDRWTWRDSGYQTGTEVDCSSFVISLLQKLGYDTGNASYTGNMSDELCAHGWVRLPNDGSPQRGDILLNDSRHVALYIGDGLLIQASCGEPGHRVSGGEAGDQTDYETNCKGYYDEPWDCYLRYQGATNEDDDDMSYNEEHTNVCNGQQNVRGIDQVDYIDDRVLGLSNLWGGTHDNVCNGQQGIQTRDQIDYIDARVAEILTTVSAQSAAIEALSKSQGADPATIAKSVSDAVAAKLSTIDLKVTTS